LILAPAMTPSAAAVITLGHQVGDVARRIHAASRGRTTHSVGLDVEAVHEAGPSPGKGFYWTVPVTSWNPGVEVLLNR
jgi:hypothetical protein